MNDGDYTEPEREGTELLCGTAMKGVMLNRWGRWPQRGLSIFGTNLMGRRVVWIGCARMSALCFKRGRLDEVQDPLFFTFH